MDLANELGKHLHEIDALPMTEIKRWFAYYSLKADENQRAIMAAKAKGALRNGKG